MKQLPALVQKPSENNGGEEESNQLLTVSVNSHTITGSEPNSNSISTTNATTETTQVTTGKIIH